MMRPELYTHLYNAAQVLQSGIAWPALQLYLNAVHANYSGLQEDELLQVFRGHHTLPSSCKLVDNLPPSPSATLAPSHNPSSNCEDHSPRTPQAVSIHDHSTAALMNCD
jgi:hypothetical protein